MLSTETRLMCSMPIQGPRTRFMLNHSSLRACLLRGGVYGQSALCGTRVALKALEPLEIPRKRLVDLDHPEIDLTAAQKGRPDHQREELEANDRLLQPTGSGSRGRGLSENCSSVPSGRKKKIARSYRTRVSALVTRIRLGASLWVSSSR